ncbi:MarR family transcriptional regulator [Caproiciproducens galactitolivorans]|uniref:MarR family protein n=2 Tax=Caproiciproducens galactitolivorans TaxID=642589 RepID=A0A4Z0YEU4_9FIRM|nr:MarR family transcriptional regulator [Caproiciproducens galactitolivorans]QEY33636.1 MarR family transcriptional regulator [Caproiciproducens galactitolivorans]TGJ76246.1 MarR family protein [Caproiciproducens galactitolivorans]
MTDNSCVQADEDVFHFMLFVHRALEKPFEEYFKGKFTTLQLNALCTLCANGPMTMSDLAASLHTPRQQMSKLIEKLYEDGYIVRSLDQNDRRKIRIAISEETAICINEGRKKFDKFIKSYLKGLDEADYKDFSYAIRIVNRILTKFPQR